MSSYGSISSDKLPEVGGLANARLAARRDDDWRDLTIDGRPQAPEANETHKQSIHPKGDLAMRILATTLLMLAVIYGTNTAQAQQSSCKVCSEQQHACMKNYAGPTCKSEYRMCLKSCGKKS